MSIKLAIVDDHQLFREGIAALLSANEDFEMLINERSGEGFVARLKQGLVPDVVLLDLTMPDMSGFDVLTILKKDYPTVRAIVLSMHDDGNYMVKCVRNGAYGYLLKNASEQELTEAIFSVCENKKYFNQDIAARMINLMSVEGNTPKKLSPKETQVLTLIAEGHTTKEIAEQLIVSTRTIETHRANIMKKLEVKNAAELIKKAALLNLI